MHTDYPFQIKSISRSSFYFYKYHFKVVKQIIANILCVVSIEKCLFLFDALNFNFTAEDTTCYTHLTLMHCLKGNNFVYFEIAKKIGLTLVNILVDLILT